MCVCVCVCGLKSAYNDISAVDDFFDQSYTNTATEMGEAVNHKGVFIEKYISFSHIFR